ncbi:MAG TPA: hypothetical protein P5081_19845 [Phycisphaerae bacterium]|nr:hypothetical protein [Phycisphaerae bacterium]HRW55131.1 hypothetical protein [Phycisphaerae bacterium]
MIAQPTIAPQEDIAYTPGEFPALRSDAPVAGRRLGAMSAFLCVPLLWFFPKSMGARLVSSGWSAAIVAHLISLVVAASFYILSTRYAIYNPAGLTPVECKDDGATFVMVSPPPQMSAREVVMAPFAALAAWFHDAVRARSFDNWAPIAGGGLILELVLMLIVLPVGTWGTAGERTGLLLVRCGQSLLWSTTIAIPLGVAWALAPALYRALGLTTTNAPKGPLIECLVLLWWTVVYLRSLDRYDGPADGPAWKARELTCEGCGYQIGMLPLTSRCPECGRPIAEMYPSLRRPMAFAMASGLRAMMTGFVSTLVDTTRNPDYFRTLSIRRRPRLERRYFYFVVAVSSALLGLSVTIGGSALSAPFQAVAVEVGIELACIWVLFQIFVGGLIVETIEDLSGRTRWGAMIVVSCLSSVSVVMSVVALLLSIVACVFSSISSAFPLSERSDDVCLALMIGLGAGLTLFAVCGLIGMRDLLRAVRQTRMALG